MEVALVLFYLRCQDQQERVPAHLRDHLGSARKAPTLATALLVWGLHHQELRASSPEVTIRRDCMKWSSRPGQQGQMPQLEMFAILPMEGAPMQTLRPV